MKKRVVVTDHIRTATIRASKIQYILGFLYILQTIVFHATKLITPDLLMKRWVAVSILMIVSTIGWVVAKHRTSSAKSYYSVIILLIIADIAFAAFNVYTQRGYASKSVLLFMIPIVISAVLVNRAMVIATAIVAAIVYSATVVIYFVRNFNEGYMAEMYSEMAFYSGIFIMTAYLLWSTMHKYHTK